VSATWTLLRSQVLVWCVIEIASVLKISLHFLFVEYKVHAYNRNGLCAVGFMDDHYPVRSAFSLLNQVRVRAMCIGSMLYLLFVAYYVSSNLVVAC
jgi:hypothetical protein